MKRSLFSRFKKQAGLITLVSALSFFVGDIFGQVSGIVFRDVPMNGTTLNVYGQKDANEVGVEGVDVLVTDVTGATFSATTAPSTGAWSVTGATLPVRVEFSWAKTGLKPSPDGTQSNTTVQFVAAPSTSVDLGVHVPKDFNRDTNPWVFSSIYIAGDPLPVGSPSGAINSLVGTHYNTTGQNPVDRYTASTTSDNGTTWHCFLTNNAF